MDETRGPLRGSRLRMFALVLAVMLLAGRALDGTPAKSQTVVLDTYRMAHVYEGHPVADLVFSSDSGAVSTAAPIAVEVPDELGIVDVTMTLTVDYRTSPNARGGLSMHLAGAHSRPLPNQIALGAAPTGHTTTIVWISRNVDATTGPLELQWTFGGTHVEGMMFVKVRSATIVVEASPTSG